MNICELIVKYCAKREKIKVEKATEEPDKVLKNFSLSELPEVVKIAINEIGIKEHPGQNHNPRIVEYHNECELKAKTDEISWCSAFVNWCLYKNNDETRTKSAAAISWRNWGKETHDPNIGDIVIFRRVNSSWRGHVGFYMGQDEKRVLVLGGNQGNSVSFQWYPKKGKSIYLFQYRTA